MSMEARRDGHGRSRPDSWSGLPLAREAAAAHGSSSVGTQHLLLALLARPQGTAQRVLRSAGITREGVEEAVASLRGAGPWPAAFPADRVTMSDRVEVLLGRAAEVRSETPGDGQVRDEDVLVALLDSRDRATAQIVLGYLGVNRRLTKRLLRQLVGPADAPGENPVNADE